jgi:membrane protease YdiL (CAAX protease family)
MGIRPLTSHEPFERTELTESNAAPPYVPRRTVMIAGIGLEGALLTVSALWAWWREMSWSFALGAPETPALLLCLGVLAGLNVICFSPSPAWAWKAECSHFLTLFVLPLVRDLTPVSALVLALFSGIAEEVFFRGVLMEELLRFSGSAFFSHIASAFLFSIIHFGPSAIQFPRVVLIYWLAGLVLGLSYSLSGSLAVPIAVHVLYNFGAFVILTKGFRRS